MSEIRQVATISQQVYDILKEDICKGKYAPGEKLLEVKIARELNVSRSPVREALHQLSGDGITVEVANRGVFVREFNAQDIEEIFEVRVALECTSLSEMKKLDPEQRQQLQDIMDALQKCYDRKALDRYIDMDEKLHRSLVVFGGNGLMLQLYDKVKLMSMQFRTYSLQSEKRFNDSIKEHAAIVENMLNGNMNKAAQINRRHLKLARDQVLEFIKAKS